MIKLLALAIMIGISLITSIGMLLLKKGSAQKKTKNKKEINSEKKTWKNSNKTKTPLNKIVNQFVNKNVIIGTLAYFIGSIAFIWLLKTQQLSFLYPITAINYFFITFLSVKFLNEKMSKYKWIGIITIVAGVIIISI